MLTGLVHLAPMLSRMVLTILFHFAAIVLGFEQDSYTFPEPNPGTTMRTEEVCVALAQGELGRDLTVNVIWTPVTATGMRKVVTLSLKSACYYMGGSEGGGPWPTQ